MVDSMQAIVIDNGSQKIKAGFAGDDSPAYLIDNIYGEPRKSYTPIMPLGNTSTPEFYVGEEAQQKRGVCVIHPTMRRGVIEQWTYMTRIWEHCLYNQMQVNPEEHPCLITETPLNPLSNREKIAEIFFEHFKVPCLQVAVQGDLVLYASGFTTGIVVDSGDSVTQITAAYEGQQLKYGDDKLYLGGSDLTTYLKEMIEQEHRQIKNSNISAELYRDMKEKHCYVALDYSHELEYDQSKIEEEYQVDNNIFFNELPDHSTLILRQERFKCAEALFQPQLIDRQFSGLADTLYENIQQYDKDIRKDFYTNIIVAGGTTLLPGFVERLNLQLNARLPTQLKANITAPVDRHYSVWVGASNIVSLNSFQNHWITQSQYKECGPQIMHKKGM